VVRRWLFINQWHGIKWLVVYILEVLTALECTKPSYLRPYQWVQQWCRCHEVETGSSFTPASQRDEVAFYLHIIKACRVHHSSAILHSTATNPTLSTTYSTIQLINIKDMVLTVDITLLKIYKVEDIICVTFCIQPLCRSVIFARDIQLCRDLNLGPKSNSLEISREFVWISKVTFYELLMQYQRRL